MVTQLVKPAPGRQVRRPDQGFTVLPEEGALVAWSPYWQRALIEGDVVVIDPVEEVASDAPKSPTTKVPKGAGSDV